MTRSLLFSALAAALASASFSGAVSAQSVVTSFGNAGGAPQAPWKVVGLPQQTKPFTRFSVVDV